MINFTVVVDRKHDKNAETGMFELAYKQIIPPVQPYMGQNLVVRGSKIEDGRFKKKSFVSKPKKRKLSNLWSVPTRSLGSDERGRSGNKTCAARSESKSTTSINSLNKCQKKENVTVRFPKNRHDASFKNVFEDLKNGLEGEILSRKQEKIVHKSQAEEDFYSFLLPAVNETMKCKLNSRNEITSRTLNDSAEILPPIEVPSR